MNLLRGITAVGFVGFLTAVSVVPADAKATPCRSDPAVLLSDGTVVDLSADIAADLWDVTEVHYEIHVPFGVGVVGVIRTPDWPTTKETFTVLTDNTAGRYDTTTLVRVGKSRVDVTANLIVKTVFASAFGRSGLRVRLGVSVP